MESEALIIESAKRLIVVVSLFNDGIGSMNHESYLFCFDLRFDTFIKMGNSLLFKNEVGFDPVIAFALTCRTVSMLSEHIRGQRL